MMLAATIALSVIAFLFGTDVYVPSMPALSQYFQVSSDTVQLTLTTYMAGAVLGCFASGPIGDTWGNRPTFLGFFSVALVASVFCPLAPTIDTLICARFFQGLGTAVASTLGLSLVHEAFPPKIAVRMYGGIGIALGIVPAIAPIVGGYLNEWFGWRANFGAVLLMNVTAFVFLLMYLPRTLRTRTFSIASTLKAYRMILTRREFLCYALLAPCIYAGEWCIIGMLPFYFQEYIGMSSATFGLLMAGILFWYGVGSFAGGSLAAHYSIDRLIWMTLGIGIIGAFGLLGAALWMPKSTALICWVLCIYMIAYGLLLPTSIMKALGVFDTLRNTASSVRSVMIMASGFVGTYAAKLMDESSLFPLSCFLVFVTLLSVLIFIWGRSCGREQDAVPIL